MISRQLRVFRLILVGITIVIPLAACSPPSPIPVTATPTTDASPLPADTETPTAAPEPVAISISLGSAPQTLDPVMVAPLDSSGHDLIANLFVGLTYLDPETGLVEPAFATHWDRSSDGLTWTVYLRDDIFWMRLNPTTGEQVKVRPVNANDVVAAAKRACSVGQQAPLAATIFLIQGCRDVYSLPAGEATPERIDQTLGVRVLNDVVVEFKLTKDSAIFPTLLAMPILYPVPVDLIESAGQEWTAPAAIVTSGPFLLDPTVSPADGFRLVANENWPLARTGNVETIQISTASPADAYESWKAGDLAVAPVPPDHIGSTPFGDDPHFWLQALPAVALLGASYDTPPLDKPAVRRAFSLAVDRQALIDSTLEANGIAALPAQSVIPPGMASAPPYGSTGAGFDPEAAQAALAEAGYPNCIGLPPVTLLVDDSEVSAALGDQIAGMWRSTFGCNEHQILLEQRPFQQVLYFIHEPPNQIQRQFRPLRDGMIMLIWEGESLDADHWLADVVGCRETFPRSYLNSKRDCVAADAALLQAESNQDGPARAADYGQIEQDFFGAQGEMPAVPLFFYARPLAFQPWVEFYPLHAGPLRFDRWVVHPH